METMNNSPKIMWQKVCLLMLLTGSKRRRESLKCQTQDKCFWNGDVRSSTDNLPRKTNKMILKTYKTQTFKASGNCRKDIYTNGETFQENLLSLSENGKSLWHLATNLLLCSHFSAQRNGSSTPSGYS